MGFGRHRLAAALGLVALAITPAALAGKTTPGSDSAKLSADTAQAPSCSYATSPVFSAYGDSAHYFLVPGGDAETSAGWTGTGKVGYTPGLGSLGRGSRSYQLASKSTLLSPTFCITADSPTMRFSVGDPGVAGSTLTVNAVWTSPLTGEVHDITIGTVKSSAAGTRVVQPLYLWANLAGFFSADNTWTMQLRFTANGGTWLVDDVYVDPFKRV